MAISESMIIPRGRRGAAIICDLNTGRTWKVRDASCGEPHCRCAAEIEREVINGKPYTWIDISPEAQRDPIYPEGSACNPLSRKPDEVAP